MGQDSGVTTLDREEEENKQKVLGVLMDKREALF